MNKNKIIVSIFVLPILIISSCSKTNSINQDFDYTSNLSEATKQSISSGTITGIKQSYGLLINDEKQMLWDTKWNAILRNDKDKLTKEQTNIITMIKGFVGNKTIAALMKDPSDGEKFIKNNLAYFEKHFTTTQLYLLIECSYFCNDFSIFKAENYIISIDERYIVNDITPTYVAGGKCTCYYSIYCSVGGGGGGSCDTEATCTKNANCGLTGTSNCTGKCSG
jgi:hypothetical protein